MKILEERYPIGTIPGQRTPGRYIDGYLYENLKIPAKKIVNDMTFMGVISSSTLEVGTGKSTFVQQLSEAYLECVREIHGIDNRLTMDNICFRPKVLIERAFKVPRYSVIILDEWEDAHYWSELGISLRQFFRKCRQLNLFILLIIPNFFQLPMNYAISRSLFFIDVKFTNEFERGTYSFYSFVKKKELYIKGKRNQDYSVTSPDFNGNFSDGYVVDEKEYRKAKYDDMINAEKEDEKKIDEHEITKKIFKKLHESLNKISVEELSNAFGISRSTGFNWLKDANEDFPKENEKIQSNSPILINNPI